MTDTAQLRRLLPWIFAIALAVAALVALAGCDAEGTTASSEHDECTTDFCGEPDQGGSGGGGGSVIP